MVPMPAPATPPRRLARSAAHRCGGSEFYLLDAAVTFGLWPERELAWPIGSPSHGNPGWEFAAGKPDGRFAGIARGSMYSLGAGAYGGGPSSSAEAAAKQASKSATTKLARSHILALELRSLDIKLRLLSRCLNFVRAAASHQFVARRLTDCSSIVRDGSATANGSGDRGDGDRYTCPSALRAIRAKIRPEPEREPLPPKRYAPPRASAATRRRGSR